MHVYELCAHVHVLYKCDRGRDEIRCLEQRHSVHITSQEVLYTHRSKHLRETQFRTLKNDPCLEVTQITLTNKSWVFRVKIIFHVDRTVIANSCISAYLGRKLEESTNSPHTQASPPMTRAFCSGVPGSRWEVGREEGRRGERERERERERESTMNLWLKWEYTMDKVQL